MGVHSLRLGKPPSSEVVHRVCPACPGVPSDIVNNKEPDQHKAEGDDEAGARKEARGGEGTHAECGAVGLGGGHGWSHGVEDGAAVPAA